MSSLYNPPKSHETALPTRNPQVELSRIHRIDDNPMTFENAGYTRSGEISASQSGKAPSSLPIDNNLETDDSQYKKRDHWSSKVEFILSVIGFAVDLGNIWRFPYICYRNGGGAFIIAYIIMYLFGGLPMFYLEMVLGQYHRSGCISIWEKICPFIKGIGFGMITISFIVGTYYETIIGWAFYFLFDSFRSDVPWNTCTAAWNTPTCMQTISEFNVTRNNLTLSENVTSSTFEYFFYRVLRVQESDGLARLGSITWQLPLCVLLVKIIIYFSLFKGVTGSGKVIYVTATLPYIMLIILLIRTAMLDGSRSGIIYYLTPQWERLLKAQVWTDAAAQVYFSLGPGFGVLLTYSSYNKFHNNCVKDAVITSLINCFTSFLAGFTVFSVLGYMSLKLGQPMSKVASSADGPALVFIAYPEAISTLPIPTLWAILFFLMVITLGLDSSFGGNEGIVTGVMDQWPNAFKKREYFLILLVGCTYLISFANMSAGGYYLITLLDLHAAPISLLFIAFCEAGAVAWFYDIRKVSKDIDIMTKGKPFIGWKILWAGITPLFLIVLFIASIIFHPGVNIIPGYTYPTWAPVLGWLVVSASLVWIPSYFIYRLIATKGSFKTRLKRMSTGTESVHRHIYELEPEPISP